MWATPALGKPLPQFTLTQIMSIQGTQGEVQNIQRTFVQRQDGSHAKSETYNVPGRGACEAGASFTELAKTTFNSCTLARSTFPGNEDVNQQNLLRTQTTCSRVFSGSKLVHQGTMFGVRTEEFVYDNPEEKGLYVASPDLACLTISEAHEWREQGVWNGAITTLTTTSLTSEASDRLFTIAQNYNEMKPSEARNLWAEALHKPTTAACYRSIDARLDMSYESHHQLARDVAKK